MSFLYYISWIVTSIYIKTFYKFEIKSEIDLKNLSGPLIITPNHKTYIDAYAVLISFSLKSKVHPIHTMAADWLYKNPLRRFYLNMVHTMPTLRGQGLEASLKISKKVLSDNGVILLFPEGGINENEGVLDESKIGPAALSLETNAHLLPIAIKIADGFCRVSVGKAYSLDEKNIQIARYKIMQKIKELYNNI